MKRIAFLLALNTLTMNAKGQNKLIWNNQRALTELNASNETDAFPWISGDGSRLYCTQGSPTAIYQYEWEAQQNQFANPQKLFPQFAAADQGASWLTEDELTIFFIYAIPSADGAISTTLYKATRSSISEAFGEASIIELKGMIGFVTGISLTPDQSQMLVYNNVIDSYIQVLEQTNDSTYTRVSSLDLPANMKPSSGQLSRDGLNYYCALTEGENNPYRIYMFTREDLVSSFASESMLDGSINQTSADLLQPTLTTDQRTMVLVQNDGGLWEDNDLVMVTAEDNPTSLEFNSFAKTNLSVISDEGTISIQGIMNNSGLLKIYSLDGRLVFEKGLNEGIFSTSLTLSNKGIYLCQTQSETGMVETKKFIVR